MTKLIRPFLLVVALVLLVACGSDPSPTPPPLGPEAPLGPQLPTAVVLPAAQVPTPDPSPTPGPAFQAYTVRRGDTLAVIADRFNANVDDIMRLNGMADPNVLQIGQVLRIPVEVDRTGPADKLIPDSEAVYGPTFAHFDVTAFARQYGGYLVGYQERVEGDLLTGPQIIQLVAERFSVGPRVLLTILEMQGGWVTSNAIGPTQLTYPLGYLQPGKDGLYKQAFWVASFLNEGFYGKLSGRLTTFEFTDKSRARVAAGVNAGTVAVQDALAHETTFANWQTLLGPNGFRATYQKLFGDPFSYAVEPLVPRELKQPTLRLPFPDGHLWYFTGGPHAGWADGSAWAAVDFTPKDQAGSCWTSADWAIAAAPGLIVQAEHGRVIENLDGSGFQGSGWTLMYMHMAAQDRVDIGTHVSTGDHIGHPSCEGGAAETSHEHFARLYNGEWIEAADKNVPMVLSGWVVQGSAQEYDGTLVRGANIITANDAQVPDKNGITADAGQ